MHDALLPLRSEPSPGQRVALVVGVNGQPVPGRDALKFAVDDAREMADVLHRSCGFELFRSPLLGEQATTENVREAVLDLADRLADHDQLLFYFSGHGEPRTMQGDVDDIYFVTHNFSSAHLRRDPRAHLSMRWLRSVLYELERSVDVLIVLDCCYAGNIGELAPDLYRDELLQRLATYFDSPPATRETPQKGLRITLSATAPGMIAHESDGHSNLTKVMLPALQGNCNSAFDTNRVDCITFTSLYSYLESQLKEQSPRFFGSGGLLVLATYPGRAAQLHHGRQQAEQKQRLQALFADHSSFIRNRLESFVGRTLHLAEIREHIEEKMGSGSGGYVTITGQAGQGKSSVIAKLVHEHIAEQGTEECVAYHFIPFNPGPDHQVGLLRNLIARLIFKHDLSDLYIDYVAHGNRPALRDFFPRVLQEIVEKGKQEVIFIDGLDQIEEDFNGVRDLTFLPTDPPPGIVFLLGTRPDDTLHPLELLKPHYQYWLPHLSRSDFDLILQHRNVHLSAEISDQFYRTMQANALFLDLAARELTGPGEEVAPAEMMQKLANNPSNLFSFALKRLQRAPEWEIIEQVLGLLLTSREPLAFQHIRQIIGARDYRLRGALARLGGLLTESTVKGEQEQRSYTLFHLMFQDFLVEHKDKPQKDYLFATAEVEHYHSILARWCAGEKLDLIWQESKDQVEQRCRVYARQHYLTHLYLGQQWQHLFDLLDGGDYGRGKVQWEPSTRAYSLDLKLGCLAAAADRWAVEKGIENLTVLWRYTLLQCSLASRADNYPNEALQLLLLLGQEAKAIGLAELLTSALRKVEVFIQIAKHLAEHPGGKGESQQWLTRASEVAKKIEDAYDKERALRELGQALAQAGQWERAEAVIGQFERAYPSPSGRTFRELVNALGQAGQWERAERVISHIWARDDRVSALSELGQALALSGQWERADAVWREAATVMGQIEYAHMRGSALRELGQTMVQVGQWERADAVWREAETIMRQIEDARIRGSVLSELGQALAQAGQWERAEGVWREAEAMMGQIEHADNRGNALNALGQALSQSGQMERAEVKISQIKDAFTKGSALSELGQVLAQAGQWERAERAWREAEAVMGQIEDIRMRWSALRKLGQALTRAGQWERAERVIGEIEDAYDGWWALSGLGQALARAGQWERAERVWREAEGVIAHIEDASMRERAWSALVEMLCEAGKLERGLAVNQRLWLKATTRKEALTLLNVAHPFIVLKPELGTAFFEAFAWVDSFLKG